MVKRKQDDCILIAVDMLRGQLADRNLPGDLSTHRAGTTEGHQEAVWKQGAWKGYCRHDHWRHEGHHGAKCLQ